MVTDKRKIPYTVWKPKINNFFLTRSHERWKHSQETFLDTDLNWEWNPQDVVDNFLGYSIVGSKLELQSKK